MYLQIDDISFTIDGSKLKARKFIGGKLYSLTFTAPESVKKLWELLTRLNNLPNEFWKPLI